MTYLRFGAVLLAAMPGFAAAQEQAATPEVTTIEDIVVTAQRRSERLQDVPVAVTAVSSERLEAVGIQSSMGLTTVTPGLTFPQAAGFGQPHIRGVGSSTNGPGLEQPVATYIDGVYIAAAPASLLTLNNIERVEVLKGPQGTLFGRNATGGLIQIITRDPKHDFSGQANVSYGNYKDVVGDLYLTGGLGDTLAADIALRYERQGDGYGRNLATGNEIGKLNHDFAGRSKIYWTPSDLTQVKLAVDYESSASSRDSQRLDDQYPTTFNNALFGGPYPQGGVHDTSYSFDQINRLKSGGISGQIVQSIGDITLQSTTAYRETRFVFPLDVDGVPPFILHINPLKVTSKQISQELQLSSGNSGRLKWVAGLFYFHVTDRYDPGHIAFGPTPISPVPNVPLDLVVQDRVRSESVAGYAQATYEIFDRTNLTLGARYTTETKKIDGTQSTYVAGTLVAVDPIVTPASGIPTKSTFNRFTYRIALDHKINADTLIYVSYNTGFKSGGYNLGSQNNPPYKPELLNALEGGVKADFLDRRLRVNLSVFDYRYSNIQVGRYVGGNIFIYNGAKAHNYGLEAETQLLVTKGLSLLAGFSYLHARFTSFPNADFIAPNPAIPVPNLAGIVTGDAAGKRLPFSPTTTLNLGANYELETSLGTFTFNSNYYRTSKFYGAPDNVLLQKAYDLIDMSLMWKANDSGLSVKGYVRNLGDTKYRTSLTEATQGGVASFGAPRTYGVTLGYKF